MLHLLVLCCTAQDTDLLAAAGANDLPLAQAWQKQQQVRRRWCGGAAGEAACLEQPLPALCWPCAALDD
jgi:hypothetical protein